VGKCEILTLVGRIEQRSNVNAVLTVRVKYAGVTVQTLTGPDSTVIAANTPIRIVVYTTVRSIGGTGTMQVNGILEIMGAIVDNGAAALPTIDTTTAQDTTITVQWGESNAADILNVEQGFVECVETNK